MFKPTEAYSQPFVIYQQKKMIKENLNISSIKEYDNKILINCSQNSTKSLPSTSIESALISSENEQSISNIVRYDYDIGRQPEHEKYNESLRIVDENLSIESMLDYIQNFVIGDDSDINHDEVTKWFMTVFDKLMHDLESHITKESDIKTIVDSSQSMYKLDFFPITKYRPIDPSINLSIFDKADYAFDMARDQNSKITAELLRIMADSGSIPAICEYSLKLRFGDGISVNTTEADRWFEKLLIKQILE